MPWSKIPGQCEYCGGNTGSVYKRRYCSNACRQRAKRLRAAEGTPGRRTSYRWGELSESSGEPVAASSATTSKEKGSKRVEDKPAAARGTGKGKGKDGTGLEKTGKSVRSNPKRAKPEKAPEQAPASRPAGGASKRGTAKGGSKGKKAAIKKGGRA